MKKVLFIALLIFAALSIYSYGQELTPKQGKNGKYGFVDKQGKEVIPYKYEYVGSFSEGLAKAKYNGKFGFIDEAGKVIIPFTHEYAVSFSEGLAIVHNNEKYGCIDKTGAAIIPIIHTYDDIMILRKKENVNFSSFAQNYVENRINKWQVKGEFEKTVDWQNRVNETTRNEKAKQLLKEAEEEFIKANFPKTSIKMELGIYDADNEVFLITSDLYGNLLVPIPHNEAQKFKDNWNTITKTPKYFIENDFLALAEITFIHGDKTYKYNNQASLNYTIANIDYNFAPINVDIAEKPSAQQGQQNISTININAGNLSDVAKNIPTTNIKNDKTFAVIIANENYRREAQVIFAKNDGEIFKKYCIQTLGLPEKNVHYTTDATLNEMRGEINWITNVANAFNGEANIIFYYAGHGIPDESSRTAYLLPVDGYGSDVTTGYKLDDLYTKLGAVPAKSVIVFMDACFSGAQRSGEMLASARGVRITAKSGAPTGNMVVFSAAQGDETAYPYHEKGHGLFTYFLLKKLQETEGNVTLGELDNYITANVKQESIVVNRKTQTPTVTASAAMGDSWRELKLK